MAKQLTALTELLTLAPIAANSFSGQSQDFGSGRIFGGQALGQALAAAYQTVPADRQVHSLHSYFLRAGDAQQPVVYNVDRIRDGNSFTTRRVIAVQNERPIFDLTASFQIDEPGFDHQDIMPAVPQPDDLTSEYTLRRRFKKVIPAPLQAAALIQPPLDIRPVVPKNPYRSGPRSATYIVWFRAIGELPDAVNKHHCLLAYASDFLFLPTALYPHGVLFFQPEVQMASLDHAMWFHRHFRMDDWLLYVVDSPSASGARGLVRGKIFNQQGQLVAATAQEGLIRPRPRQQTDQ